MGNLRVSARNDLDQVQAVLLKREQALAWDRENRGGLMTAIRVDGKQMRLRLLRQLAKVGR